MPAALISRKLWAQIEAIKIPARSQLTPTLPQATAQPSAEARAAKFKREGYKVASYAAFVVAGLGSDFRAQVLAGQPSS